MNSERTQPEDAVRPGDGGRREPLAPLPARRLLLGFVLACALGYVAYLGLRGYVTPEMLVSFSNALYLCH